MAKKQEIIEGLDDTVEVESAKAPERLYVKCHSFMHRGKVFIAESEGDKNYFDIPSDIDESLLKVMKSFEIERKG